MHDQHQLQVAGGLSRRPASGGYTYPCTDSNSAGVSPFSHTLHAMRERVIIGLVAGTLSLMPYGHLLARGTPRVPSAPMVIVQAGHQAPMEPGYRAQTGAPGGPFGSEAQFNIRTTHAVIHMLRAEGIIAIESPGKVTPYASRAAIFLAIHFDAAGGRGSIGYAVYDPPNNRNVYYHGQGIGTPRDRPYPDSAPQRASTRITAQTQAHSYAFAVALNHRYRAIFTRANGADGTFLGIQPGRSGNPRMQYYYGFRRTNATARVIIECGAVGSDTTFLGRTSLIASAISRGIIDYLTATGAVSAQVSYHTQPG